MGTRVIIQGRLVAFDERTAAGISGEFEMQGCHVRLRVERIFRDEWTETEGAYLSTGQDFRVDDLCTIVQNEAVIDISDPVLTD